MLAEEAIKLLREQEKHTYEEYSHQTAMGLPSPLLDFWLQEQVAMIEMAISSLAIQIPKKPDFVGEGYDDEGQLVYDTWVCPNCETSYECDYDDYDFCPKCGQKIDWSE